MKCRKWALAAGVASAVSAVVACYGPTEVRLEISTDRPCTAPRTADEPNPLPVKTAVAIGQSAADVAPITEVSTCDDAGGQIGSIVVVPSGAHDARVAVQVTMTTNGRPTTDCVLDAKGNPPSFCIVARRSFAFIDHTSRTLPIRLYDACRGVGCGAEDTCGRGGGCRPAEVSEGDEETVDTCVGPQCADAGPASDAAPDTSPTVDAAPRACTGANGDHLVSAAVGGVSEQLAANSTRLFWEAPSPGGGYEVHSVSKNGGPIEVHAAAKPLPEVVAMAVDDASLWVASASVVTRYDLSSKQSSSHPLARVSSIAMRTSNGTTATYFAVPRSPSGGPGTLYVADTPASVPRLLDGAYGGEHVAIAGPYAYVVDGAGNTIYRHNLPWPAPGDILGGVVTPITGSPAYSTATSGTRLFFVELDKSVPDGKLRVVDDPPGSENLVLTTVARPGRIAADGQYAYYLDHGALDTKPPGQGAVRRVATVAGPILPATAAPVAAGFDDVHGLVVDACVYFFASASPSQLAGPRLVVYPKDPSAP